MSLHEVADRELLLDLHAKVADLMRGFSPIVSESTPVACPPRLLAEVWEEAGDYLREAATKPGPVAPFMKASNDTSRRWT
jgi:hypothetical protein